MGEGLGDSVCGSCPLPVSYSFGDPLFEVAGCQGAVLDDYFLSICSFGFNGSIVLRLPRVGPAKPRLMKWVSDNLPGSFVDCWEVACAD